MAAAFDVPQTVMAKRVAELGLDQGFSEYGRRDRQAGGSEDHKGGSSGRPGDMAPAIRRALLGAVAVLPGCFAAFYGVRRAMNVTAQKARTILNLAATRFVDQHRVGEAKFADRGGDLHDLLVAVRARVSGVGDQRRAPAPNNRLG
jgi:hypothetical protein